MSDKIEELSAGLCPRCAGTGRDPSGTALQCSKCMGQGAVVIRGRTPPNTVGSGELDAAPAWLKERVGTARTDAEIEANPGLLGARAMAAEQLKSVASVKIPGRAALPVDHPEVVGDEHHEFVSDPYRPSQCVNCGRSHAARIHAALHPSDSPALDAGKLRAAMEQAMDIYQADDVSDIGEAMFMVLHSALSPTRETGK